MTEQPLSALRHPLPRGRHAAPRAIVWESQRERMLEAMASAVAEKGYGATAVADVLARAGVSRKTFYEHFANKEECFLAAYDEGVDRLLEAIEEATAQERADPLAAATAGTRCYLESLAANPAFARTFEIEILAAGPAALERRNAVHERFAAQLAGSISAIRAATPGIPEPPRHVVRACVGAINELVIEHLLREGAESLPRLLDAVLDVELRLLLADAAR